METLLNRPITWINDSCAGAKQSSTRSSRLRIALVERLVAIGAFGDALMILGACLLGFYLRFETSLFAPMYPHGTITVQSYGKYVILGTITLLGVLASLGLYQPQQVLQFRQTAHIIAKGLTLWVICMLSLAMLFHFVPSISRIYLAVSSGLVGVALLTWRGVLHQICQRQTIASQLRQRVLLVGWNEDAARLASLVQEEKHSSYEMVGFVPSARENIAESHVLDHLGDYEELSEVLRTQNVDIVILTDLNATRQEIIEIADICEREMVQFQLVPSYFQVLLSGLHLQIFSGVPLLGVSKLPLQQIGNRILKRAVDIAGAIVGLVLSIPLGAIFGCLVYLESPGAIFFAQERVGRRGQRFKMYKIRSMRLDAAQTDHLQQSTGRTDPRLLRVGAFMRRWNIDEVPQFWNVLKGEMSLVGPRPERTYHSVTLSNVIPHYNARYIAKPGITGWAQINGLRGDTDLSERVRYDLFYMENWNLWLDLQTMLFTFFKRSNAY